MSVFLKTISSVFWLLVFCALAFCGFKWNQAVNRADRAERALVNYQTEVQRATDAENLRRKLLFVEGESRVKTIEVDSQATLDRLKVVEGDRARLQNLLKGYKDEKVFLEKRISDTNVVWADRVRLEAERVELGLPDEPEIACDPAHTGIGCNTTPYQKLEEQFGVLRDACEITTVDLLTCLDVVDNDTKTVGREQ